MGSSKTSIPANLRAAIWNVLGGAQDAPPALEIEKIRSTVTRVRSPDLAAEAVIVKRLPLGRAHLEQKMHSRWLPALAMASHGSPLLAAVGDADGSGVWHIYEDLGAWSLDRAEGSPSRVHAAVALLAKLHVVGADCPWLAEVRLWGRDLGSAFYITSARDALRCIDALMTSEQSMPEARRTLCDRLAGRLRRMIEEFDDRARTTREHGGPETLLHGDPGLDNAFVSPAPNGAAARFIDWDHAGVGPAAYDLSTFLVGLPRADRAAAFEAYCRSVGELGWQPPTASVANKLFETAELARLADTAKWAALAIGHGKVQWGFEELARVDQWFAELRPVLDAA